MLRCLPAIVRRNKATDFGAIAATVCFQVTGLLMGFAPGVHQVAHAGETAKEAEIACLTVKADVLGDQVCADGVSRGQWGTSWHRRDGIVAFGDADEYILRTPSQRGGAGTVWPMGGWTYLTMTPTNERPSRPLCAAPVGLT